MMTIIEYINKISDNGCRCALPDELFHQRTEENTIGDCSGGRQGYTVVKYTSESIGEAKRELRLLKDITMRAMNCKGDNCSISRLFAAIVHICPRQLTGSYDELKVEFKEWFLMFIDTICSSISTKMLTERNCPGARYWLTTLQTRMESWQKQVNVEVDKESEAIKSVSINFGGF